MSKYLKLKFDKSKVKYFVFKKSKIKGRLFKN